MSWRAEYSPEIPFENKKCLHTVLWGSLSSVCVLVGMALYLLVSAWAWAAMVWCLFMWVCIISVCWFFIHKVKKKNVPMRLLFFSPSIPCSREKEKGRKHLSGAVVHSSNTSQACHLRVALCLMHIHNFFPSQDIEQTENSAHTLSLL